MAPRVWAGRIPGKDGEHSKDGFEHAPSIRPATSSARHGCCQAESCGDSPNWLHDALGEPLNASPFIAFVNRLAAPT